MDHERIFGTPLDINSSNNASCEPWVADLSAASVRSPRKQMFSDLSTPAHDQTSFKSNDYWQASPQRNVSDTGLNPVQQSYYQLSGRQQGDGGHISPGDTSSGGQGQGRYQYANTNSNSSGLSAPTSRQAKRESSTFFMTGLLSSREPSLTQLNENEAF